MNISRPKVYVVIILTFAALVYLIPEDHKKKSDAKPTLSQRPQVQEVRVLIPIQIEDIPAQVLMIFFDGRNNGQKEVPVTQYKVKTAGGEEKWFIDIRDDGTIDQIFALNREHVVYDYHRGSEKEHRIHEQEAQLLFDSVLRLVPLKNAGPRMVPVFM